MRFSKKAVSSAPGAATPHVEAAQNSSATARSFRAI